MDTQHPDWFDVADLARRYKTSTRHIFRMDDRGQMPWGMKLGHLRRWSRDEIVAWEATGCAPVRQGSAASGRR
jgi:predicted DNA-binding transcriptional regulator AlpA